MSTRVAFPKFWRFIIIQNMKRSFLKCTVKSQLSELHGRHTIVSDNRGVRIDEENRNSPSMGYQVGDN